ncbi:HYR domain-containing protein [bacterium SCSIO 12741]|nr:HYR domain-containing protein [bacterium SCSIO 12741]
MSGSIGKNSATAGISLNAQTLKRTILALACLFLLQLGSKPLAAESLPLVIDCPSNVFVDNDSGKCGAIVHFGMPTVSDQCSVNGNSNTTVITQIGGLPSGSLFPVGTTTVTFAALNACGDEDTCDFMVVVRDVEKPTITCPSNVSFQASTDGCTAFAIWGQPNVFDNCGVTSIMGSHRARSPFPKGTTAVTYTVTDASGNTASCSFDVNVNPAPIVVTLTSGGSCKGRTDGYLLSTVQGDAHPTPTLGATGQTLPTSSNWLLEIIHSL